MGFIKKNREGQSDPDDFTFVGSDRFSIEVFYEYFEESMSWKLIDAFVFVLEMCTYEGVFGSIMIVTNY